MKKNIFLLLGCLCTLMSVNQTMAQDNNTNSLLRIGVFAPLYLDSAFSGETYLFSKKFPRFTLQGFDFVQGVKLASDSFPITGVETKTFVYDTKSDSLPLESLLTSGSLDQLQLLIAAVKEDDFIKLSGFAKEKKIPLISVTYPNDGNNTGNPYLCILNATLKTHCESIFSSLLKNHASHNIIHVHPTGSQEEKVTAYFNTFNTNDGASLLSIRKMRLDSNFYQVKSMLDSTRKNVIIGGSLNEEFAASLAAALSPLRKKYDIRLIGMPNWESFAFLGKNAKPFMKDFPVYFTSSYYNPRTDSISHQIESYYTNHFKGKASDFVYKGFESYYVFCRLLHLYGPDLPKNFNDRTFSVFTDYNLSPVQIKAKGNRTDYYENKQIYFLKRVNGFTFKE